MPSPLSRPLHHSRLVGKASTRGVCLALSLLCGLTLQAQSQNARRPAPPLPTPPIAAPLASAHLAPLMPGQTDITGDILVGLEAGTDENAFVTQMQHVGQMRGHSAALHAYRIHLNPGVADADVLQWLRRQHGIAYAENNHRVQIAATPNDASYNLQWAPPKVKADQAWSIWNPQGQVVIAIVDTGVDYSHPDLTNVMFKDTGGNVVGYDATNSGSFSDGYGHGTHCAGIAAAQINNGTSYTNNNGNNYGIAGGVGWSGDTSKTDTSHVKIMPVRVLDSSGSGTDAEVADGITWATDHGAQVISMSLGSPEDPNNPGPPATLNAAVQYAWKKGVVVVAAAGNSSTTSKFYPAACANVLSVAATDSSDTLANFSNYGSWVTVAAPGLSILSTVPTYNASANYGTYYNYLSGTSMATPHVAAEAALLLAQSLKLTNQQVHDTIITNVDPLSAGSNTIYGGNGGRVNFLTALKAVTPPATGITGLFNTGVDANGNAATQGAADAHWTLVSTPSGSSGTAYIATQNWLGIAGAWMADSNTSQWLAPTPDVLKVYQAVGNYTWQTTFTVTGDPSAVKITGQVAADNSVTAIILNGTTYFTNVVGYNTWGSFTLSSGFLSGTNTLQVIVNNSGTSANPTGFRAEVSAANASSVTTVPAAPTGLTATPGNKQVTLSWTAPAGATSYNIKRGTSNAGPFTTIATLQGATTYTDGGTKYDGSSQLSNGTLYYYVVTAMNAVGESAASNIASATPKSLTQGAITGLFNTGVDANGNAATQGAADAHWTLVSTPSGSSGTAYIATQNWLGIAGAWMADSNTSQWLAPTPDVLKVYQAVGNYTWQTTFTVTGDPSAVKITGQVAGDNSVTAIILNGTTYFTNIVGYNTWGSFTLSSGFLSGTNTLQVIVNNSGTSANPTGFRAEVTGGSQ